MGPVLRLAAICQREGVCDEDDVARWTYESAIGQIRRAHRIGDLLAIETPTPPTPNEIERGDIIGGPELDPDGRRVAFLTEQRGKASLFVMNADGSEAHVVNVSREMRGSPAWRPDGQSLTSAALVNGTPQLLHISLDGHESSFIKDYSVDPVWSPDGRYVVYSGPDIGTTFSLRAAGSDGRPISIPNLLLTRGARRVRFLSQQPRELVIMRGDLEHKDLWLVNLDTASEQQLTRLPADFNVREFDISRDGREVALERLQQRSDVLLIEAQ